MQEVDAEFQKVASAAAAAAGTAAAGPSHTANLASMLNEISDRHLLHVHHPSGLEPAEVWPMTAAQAVAGGVPHVADLAEAAATFGKVITELALLARAAV
jgi:hypothetical protein